MKITHIDVENFLGIRSAKLQLRRPVTLIAGPNGAGKSSLQEAIRMALTGETVRVGLKKDYPRLVLEGEKSGFIDIGLNDGREHSSSIVLPSGKVTTSRGFPSIAELPYVLDAQRFAHLEQKERRAFLVGLMGVKVSADDILERLKKRGADEAKAKTVLPLLRSGFDAAQKEAASKATEAKGAWRALTGETYGEVKAASWAAEKPEVDGALVEETQQEVVAAAGHLAEAQQELGRLRGEQRRHADNVEKKAQLQQKVELIDRARTKLATDETSLAEWTAKVEKAEAAARSQEALECPCCKARLQLKGHELVEAGEASGSQEEIDNLASYRQSKALVASAVQNAMRDLSQLERAEAELKAIEDAEGEPPTETTMHNAVDEVTRLEAVHKNRVAEADRLAAIARAAAAADAKTTQAAAHHADVAAWAALSEALAPDGIPADLLAETLGPINARLAQCSSDTEWAAVQLDKDMSITAGGRAYALLSESEKWRTDALLAEAISHVSQAKLLVLDRFDVLDGKGREDLLAWLDILAGDKEIDTAIVFGTLRALPAGLAETVDAQWVSGGVLGELKQAA